MSFLDYLFGQKPKTAVAAKERLQFIIAHERGGQPSRVDFLPALQRELIEVISKYTKVDVNDIKVSLEKKNQFEVLEVNITLPEIDSQR